MITITADSNEQGSPRMTKLAEAILDDPRFKFMGYEELPVDLCIQGAPIHHGHDLMGEVYSENKFFTELKEPSDYISSVLGKDGHLYEQVLKMRELGHPCMVLVLGSDEDILAAIKEATKTRYKGSERAYQIASYQDRLIDFEANCEALGCPVRRWEAMPMKRLLSTAHKILTGGNLMSYRPKPANGERELASAAMLFGNGIGCKILEPVMQDYTLRLVPRAEQARHPCDMPGIGKKRAAVIDKKISMIYGMVPA